MAKVGRTPEGKPYSVKVILGYLKSWKTLLFTLIFSMSRYPRLPMLTDAVDLRSDPAVHERAIQVFCVLAQGTQQARQETSLQYCTNSMLCRGTISA